MPVTHETLTGMSPWRSVAYLRDLLMMHGVLPAADRNLMLFERWLDQALTGITLPGHRQHLERFASWYVRRRLCRFADRGPVTGKQTGQARDEVRLAIAFLAWLHGRGCGLEGCRQADVDAWYAGGYTARRLTHAFLRWAVNSKLMPPVTVPHQDTANPVPVSQRQRLDLLRRMLTGEETELLTRVAAVLMLLYAQPLTRIMRLTLDDIACDDGEVTIRLGDPPAPVPEPFASLLLRHAGQRLNLTTATNAGARWLFPGRRGGAHDPGKRRTAPARRRDPRSQRAHRRAPPPRSPGPGPSHRRHARLRPPAGRPDRRRSRQPVEPLRPRRPRPAAVSRRRPMTDQQLQAALRAGAEGLYALESGTGLLLAHGTWPAREDFRCFIHVADSITDPGIELASI